MEIYPHSGPQRLAFALASYASASAQGATLRAVMDHLPVIAFRIDPEGRIAEASGKARTALVSARGDSTGRLVAEAYADMPDVLHAIARARAGETVEITTTVAGREYLVAYEPAQDGSVLGVALELRPLAPEAVPTMDVTGVRVLAVEPNARRRAGLTTQLGRQGVSIQASVPSTDEAVAALARGPAPDVVVLGSGAGAEPLLRIRAAYPDLYVLALVPRADSTTVAWWHEQGAGGVLGAQASGAQVAEAVQFMARTGVYVADASHLRAVSGDVLSPRQRQVACLLAQDMTRKEIAAELGIAADTVSSTTTHARKRLGVKTDVGLAVHAIREGWVRLEDV